MTTSLGIVAIVCLVTTVVAQQPLPGPFGGRGQGPGGGRFGGPPRDIVQPATGTAKITGRVVSAETGAPIRRAQIRVMSRDSRATREVMTDADGRFAILSLPAGRYQLFVSKSGYVALEYGQGRPFEAGKPIDIADGQSLERIDFSLPRGSAISGRITDEYGDAVTDAQVQAMRHQFSEGERRLVNAGRTVTTDDLGQFRIFGLMPGEYVVRASLRTNSNPRQPASPAGEDPTGYPGTFYPGVTDVAQAQTVTLTLGQELTSIAFALVPARLSRITGTVTSSDGRPLAGAMVSLRSGAGGLAARFDVAGGNQMVRPDGAFTLVNVPPGDYTLDVQQPPRNLENGRTAQLEFASLPLSVAGDIEGLAVMTTPGASVSGRVVLQGASKPQIRGIQVVATPPAGVRVPSPIFPRAFGRGSVSNTGTVEIRGLIGPQVLRVSGIPSGWGVKSISVDGTDITDTPFDFKPGTHSTGLVITLTDRITELSGEVRDVRGQPAMDYVVVVFAEDARLWGAQSRHVSTARPNQNGTFSIKGLPPARYLAAVLPALENGMQHDTELLEKLRTRSTAFSLAEGQALTMNLEMGAQ